MMSLPSVLEPQTVAPVLNSTSTAEILGNSCKIVFRYPYDELCGIALLAGEDRSPVLLFQVNSLAV